MLLTSHKSHESHQPQQCHAGLPSKSLFSLFSLFSFSSFSSVFTVPAVIPTDPSVESPTGSLRREQTADGRNTGQAATLSDTHTTTLAHSCTRAIWETTSTIWTTQRKISE